MVVLNLGSSRLGTIAIEACGFRYVVNKNVRIGAAWEQTSTDRKDLFNDRVTVNLLFKF